MSGLMNVSRYRSSTVLWVVMPRLHYGNATLAGLPNNQLSRLQSVLNAAARLVFSAMQKAWVRQSAAPWPALAASAATNWFQAGGAHVPLSPFDGSAISCRWTLQSGGRRLATAVEISVNVDAHRTADAPFHYWRPRIFGRGFASMEQPAVQRLLVCVIDSFQAAPQNRTLPPMFWLGLCLTILLSLFCIMLDSERVISAVKCSCSEFSPRILWHFNHTRS